jgi:hypothetical protein
LRPQWVDVTAPRYLNHGTCDNPVLMVPIQADSVTVALIWTGPRFGAAARRVAPDAVASFPLPLVPGRYLYRIYIVLGSRVSCESRDSVIVPGRFPPVTDLEVR